MYNNVKEVTKQPNLLVPILGFVNPVTGGLAVAVLVLYAIFRKTKKAPEKERLLTVEEPLNKPLPNGSPTVKATVPATAGNGDFNRSKELERLNDDALKKEMIRQAMSELGKRSGRARARQRME